MTWIYKRKSCKRCRGTGFVLGDTFADQCPDCRPANDGELKEALMHELSFMSAEIVDDQIIKWKTEA